MKRRRNGIRGTYVGFVAFFVVLLLGQAVFAQSVTHYTYAAHAQSWTDHLEEMAERFFLETGIQVNVIQSSGNYEEQVMVMIAGGVPPDVTDFHPEIGGTFIAADLFEDLLPYIERSAIDLSNYPPAAIEGVTSSTGIMWGFPVSVFPVVTFFNDDLFQRAGLVNPVDLGDDWTWDTFRESARRLTMDRSGGGHPDQFGVERLVSRWEQWVHQAGGQWYDRLVFPTESRFNSLEVHEAVRFLTSLQVTDGVVAPSGATYLFRSGNGNVGMTTVDGPGIIGPFMQGVTFNWDIARQPKGAAGRAARVNPDGFQILKDSPNKDASWKWIEFLVGDEERQYHFAKTTGRMPSHRDAMIRYGELPIDLPPNWMAFIETAFDPDGYAAYVVPSQVRTTVNSTMQQVWQGNIAPQEGLQQLHELVTAMITQR